MENFKVIKWTNKFSNETGYVGGTSKKNRCFYNSDVTNARRFKSDSALSKVIAELTEYGEADNNILEAVSVSL